MQGVIHVERETEGLQLALRTLFEESRVRHRMKGVFEQAEGEQLEELEAELPVREISPGYFDRAGYLLSLSNALELGIPFAPADITHSDFLGIRAVRTARAEYERDHPACPRCGERQENIHIVRCHACNQQFAGKER